MKHLRIQLGISQQQLADHLKVPKSVIAMAEIGKRPYPENLSLVLEQMQQSRIDLASKRNPEDDLQLAYVKETIQEMQNIIEANNYKLYASRFKLNEAKERLKKALTITRISENSYQPTPSQNQDETDITHSRLSMVNRRYRQKVAKEKMTIALLELKIKTLEFERDEAQKWLQENGGDLI